jgi:polysaccharide export outer membrane protein
VCKWFAVFLLKMQKLRLLLSVIVIALLQSGCVNYKNQIFFQGLSDTTYNASMQQPDPVIQRGDQLMIMVYALDATSAQQFNQVMGGAQGGNMMMQGGQGGGFMGYLVDEMGNIDFPKLGTLKVMGFSQQCLRDSLQQWLLPYLKEPVVQVRIMNFRVTYMTIDKAVTTVITNNKTNIIQFLGMVGGINYLDRKDKVMIIRQVNDFRQIINVDFTDKSIFDSPAFYLQPNDIIYVYPNNRKFVDFNLQLLTYVTTISSTISIFLLYLNNLK